MSNMLESRRAMSGQWWLWENWWLND